VTVLEKQSSVVSIACCACNKEHISVGLGYCSLMTIHDFVTYVVTDAVKSVRDLLSAGVPYISFGM
jgi:hypothetical protein